MQALMQNARLAIRQLRHNPGFTFTVVLTLGLAVGANTAIFSVVNALLLQDLPYANPERIATIFARGSGAVSFDERKNIDGEQWELLRDDVPSLVSAISGLHTSGVNLVAGRHVEYVQLARISEHYLDVLALGPVLGRN